MTNKIATILRQTAEMESFRWCVERRHLLEAAAEIERLEAVVGGGDTAICQLEQRCEAAETEVGKLRSDIRHIDRLLRVPAAEYVPAISDVFAFIDALQLPCEYCGGTGSIKVDFEHPQWVTCEACK